MRQQTITGQQIEQIQSLVLASEGIVDYSLVVALVMRMCGCSYAEIGEALDISRQAARRLVKSMEESI